MMMIIAS